MTTAILSTGPFSKTLFGALGRFSTLGQAPGLKHIYQAMLKRLASDKCSSLLGLFISNEMFL
jgi:hypothetical protein